MYRWHAAVRSLGVDLGAGESFDLDFHTIPCHGDDALIQEHYVSRRSRRQCGVLAFLACDAGDVRPVKDKLCRSDSKGIPVPEDRCQRRCVKNGVNPIVQLPFGGGIDLDAGGGGQGAEAPSR